MKRLFRNTLSIFIIGLLLLIFIGCSTIEKYVEIPEAATKGITKGNDYLGKGVVLAGVIWEDDGFYSATLFPVEIITQASDKTKGEYEVILLTGSPDVTEGSKHWTKNVILKSHPAKKDELKPEMVILYTGGDPCKEDWEELEGARWLTGVILNTDELYKDIVELKACGGYRRTYKRHLSQLRISDDPLIEPPKED